MGKFETICGLVILLSIALVVACGQRADPSTPTPLSPSNAITEFCYKGVTYLRYANSITPKLLRGLSGNVGVAPCDQ